MQVAVMQVVDMLAVTDGRVATTTSVVMSVFFMDRMFTHRTVPLTTTIAIAMPEP